MARVVHCFTCGIAPLCLESGTAIDSTHDHLFSSLHSHAQEAQVTFIRETISFIIQTKGGTIDKYPGTTGINKDSFGKIKMYGHPFQ